VDHVVAFARSERVLTVVPRLTARLGGTWGETTLGLPAGRWRDELTGSVHTGGHGGGSMATILGRFPVALLVREESV
jgi:(1->4)-alpha-D-glucan 1-alpha-D-glucosylmutase